MLSTFRLFLIQGDALPTSPLAASPYTSGFGVQGFRFEVVGSGSGCRYMGFEISGPGRNSAKSSLDSISLFSLEC